MRRTHYSLLEQLEPCEAQLPERNVFLVSVEAMVAVALQNV